MTTNFHIYVINQKFEYYQSEYLFGESISSLVKYTVLYFMTTYLYVREPLVQMK